MNGVVWCGMLRPVFGGVSGFAHSSRLEKGMRGIAEYTSEFKPGKGDTCYTSKPAIQIQQAYTKPPHHSIPNLKTKTQGNSPTIEHQNKKKDKNTSKRVASRRTRDT